MNEIREEIEKRILEGERIIVAEVAEEFFPKEDPIHARSRIHGILSAIKKRFAQDGLAICAIDVGVVGIPKTKDEVFNGMDYYRRRIEGHFKNAITLHTYAKGKNILPEGFRNKTILLPVYNYGK